MLFFENTIEFKFMEEGWTADQHFTFFRSGAPTTVDAKRAPSLVSDSATLTGLVKRE